MEQVNVAIADDNERILDLLEEIINMDKELHVVGKAKNGEEMCQIIRNKQPDVVLLDLIMPKMDGLTVMEKINQDKNVQKRPDFIVVTAVGQERITEDAFNRMNTGLIKTPLPYRQKRTCIHIMNSMSQRSKSSVSGHKGDCPKSLHIVSHPDSQLIFVWFRFYGFDRNCQLLLPSSQRQRHLIFVQFG